MSLRCVSTTWSCRRTGWIPPQGLFNHDNVVQDPADLFPELQHTASVAANPKYIQSEEAALPARSIDFAEETVRNPGSSPAQQNSNTFPLTERDNGLPADGFQEPSYDDDHEQQHLEEEANSDALHGFVRKKKQSGKQPKQRSIVEKRTKGRPAVVARKATAEPARKLTTYNDHDDDSDEIIMGDGTRIKFVLRMFS
jgi:hypothetical protein